MTELHCRHLRWDIDQFIKSTASEMVDKSDFAQKMADKWSINLSTALKLVDIINFASNKQSVTTEQIIQQFGFTAGASTRRLLEM